MAKQTRQQKHIPRRTCVACRQVRSKRELVRVVRTPTGGVVVDETGKLNGRGAYLCRQRLCWDKALKQNKLERALKTSLPAESRTRLLEFAAQLPESLESTEGGESSARAANERGS